MPTTIRDVAVAAGVSAATVSRVLNANAVVAEHLRQRVLATVDRLGYRPNGAARSLRTRATLVLGTIISDITNPFFTALVRGVEDTAQEAGYSVILANTDEQLAKEARYLEVAAAEQLAGVVLSPASAAKTDVRLLTERGIPVVIIDRRLRGAPLDSVTVNNRAVTREATRHLVDQGCRRIAFLGGPAAASTATDRLTGYRSALIEADLPFDPDLVVHGDYRVEGGYLAARALLNRVPAPDAMFVSNNLMTLGALHALDEAGIRTPNDLAFVGFDDLTWALGSRAELSMVLQPTYQIGQRAAALLLQRIRGDRSPPQKIVLSASLTVRGSSLRPGGAGAGTGHPGHRRSARSRPTSERPGGAVTAPPPAVGQ